MLTFYSPSPNTNFLLYDTKVQSYLSCKNITSFDIFFNFFVWEMRIGTAFISFTKTTLLLACPKYPVHYGYFNCFTLSLHGVDAWMWDWHYIMEG